MTTLEIKIFLSLICQYTKVVWVPQILIKSMHLVHLIAFHCIRGDKYCIISRNVYAIRLYAAQIVQYLVRTLNVFWFLSCISCQPHTHTHTRTRVRVKKITHKYPLKRKKPIQTLRQNYQHIMIMQQRPATDA